MPVGLEGANGHQVVNFFHLVGVLTSVKQFRKCALDAITKVLQRGAKAEEMGEAPWGSCLVTKCLLDRFENQLEGKLWKES